MLTCKETSKLVSQGLDSNLPFYKKILIYLHLKACITCTFYKKQITALKKLMGHYPDIVEDSEDAPCLSPETASKMKEALNKKDPS